MQLNGELHRFEVKPHIQTRLCVWWWSLLSKKLRPQTKVSSMIFNPRLISTWLLKVGYTTRDKQAMVTSLSDGICSTFLKENEWFNSPLSPLTASEDCNQALQTILESTGLWTPMMWKFYFCGRISCGLNSWVELVCLTWSSVCVCSCLFTNRACYPKSVSGGSFRFSCWQAVLHRFPWNRKSLLPSKCCISAGSTLSE